MATTSSVRIRTTGMHCQSCSMLVKMSVEDVEGVESAVSDVATGMTEVAYDPALVDPPRIVAAIEAAGYGASVEG
jgi:copper chaperone CopZ